MIVLAKKRMADLFWGGQRWSKRTRGMHRQTDFRKGIPMVDESGLHSIDKQPGHRPCCSQQLTSGYPG